MSANLFTLPYITVLDSSGDPISGAALYFYTAGTLSALDTYSDLALTTANANPVETDSAGRAGPIFLANTPYRCIIKDDVGGNTIDDIDNINTDPSSFGTGGEAKSGDYSIVIADRGKLFQVTASATIDLPTLADAGENFAVGIYNTSTADVTVDPGASTINGDNTVTLYPDGWIILSSGSSEWKAIYDSGNERGSFSATMTGFSSDPAPTVKYTRTGQHVDLMFATTGVGTSDATGMTLSSLPASIRPASTPSVPCLVEDNGTIGQGWAFFSGDTITFGNGVAGSTSGFTNSGQKGIQLNQVISYTMQ